VTIEEYLDAGRFPATTQAGLTAQQQLFLDAARWDMARQEKESGRAFDREEQKIYAELEKKMPHHKRLVREAGQRPS
jgi:hypothetical protein